MRPHRSAPPGPETSGNSRALWRSRSRQGLSPTLSPTALWFSYYFPFSPFQPNFSLSYPGEGLALPFRSFSEGGSFPQVVSGNPVFHFPLLSQERAGWGAVKKAGEGVRTLDIQLGKLTFYHWTTPAVILLLRMILYKIIDLKSKKIKRIPNKKDTSLEWLLGAGQN